MAVEYTWGTGRRKTAVARVRVKSGTGQIVINRRPIEDFFHRERDRLEIRLPLETVKMKDQYDIFASVCGGGYSSQAGAVKLGLARVLKKLHPDMDKALRDEGFLTRDAREKERKKYGRRGARARFQFSKR